MFTAFKVIYAVTESLAKLTFGLYADILTEKKPYERERERERERKEKPSLPTTPHHTSAEKQHIVSITKCFPTGGMWRMSHDRDSNTEDGKWGGGE